jgi:hypothetical protein
VPLNDACADFSPQATEVQLFEVNCCDVQKALAEIICGTEEQVPLGTSVLDKEETPPQALVY